MKHNHALVVLSGGQDSVTCLAWAANRFRHISAITFDYGQRHRVELECAERAVEYLARSSGRVPGVSFSLPRVVNASALKSVGQSALTSTIAEPVSAPHRDNPTVPASFVPGRNALFLTLAYVHALSIGADAVVTGVCQTDFSGYPDCRVNFVMALQTALEIGYLPPGRARVPLLTPLMYLDKAQTFALAKREGALDLVLEVSHTCYEGDHTTRHPWGYGCGVCPACKLRSDGFRRFEAGQYNMELLDNQGEAA
jgi:7-cyano-7-deazaguanine synthase